MIYKCPGSYTKVPDVVVNYFGFTILVYKLNKDTMEI
jgi:hypothetical protein